MMQQRLKAKLMVVRWGREAVPGAGWVSSVSRAPWKRGRRQSPPWQGCWAGRQWEGPCKAGGPSVGLAQSGNKIFVLPFPLDSAEKSVFMTRVTSGLASHGSHNFPPEHRQGHKQGCIFVPPCWALVWAADSLQGASSVWIYPEFSQSHHWAPQELVQT